MEKEISIFRISPLIQFTLISLYISLTIPLPFLAEITDSSISVTALWIGIAIGGLILVGTLSERVVVDENQIKISYPSWFSFFFHKNCIDGKKCRKERPHFFGLYRIDIWMWSIRCWTAKKLMLIFRMIRSVELLILLHPISKFSFYFFQMCFLIKIY